MNVHQQQQHFQAQAHVPIIQEAHPEEFIEVEKMDSTAENGSKLVQALLVLPKSIMTNIIPILLHPAVRKSVMLFYVSLDPTSIVRRKIESSLLDILLEGT